MVGASGSATACRGTPPPTQNARGRGTDGRPHEAEAAGARRAPVCRAVTFHPITQWQQGLREWMLAEHGRKGLAPNIAGSRNAPEPPCTGTNPHSRPRLAQRAQAHGARFRRGCAGGGAEGRWGWDKPYTSPPSSTWGPWRRKRSWRLALLEGVAKRLLQGLQRQRAGYHLSGRTSEAA